MKGSSVQGLRGAALLRVPVQPQGMQSPLHHPRDCVLTAARAGRNPQPSLHSPAQRGEKTSALLLWGAGKEGAQGLPVGSQQTHMVTAQLRVTAISYSPVNYSENQNQHQFNLHIPVDFSSSRSRWEGAEWGCEVSSSLGCPSLQSSPAPRGTLAKRSPKFSLLLRKVLDLLYKKCPIIQAGKLASNNLG